MIQAIRELTAYQQLLESIRQQTPRSGLGLPRSARIPVLAALAADCQRPVLLITHRADLALKYLEELGYWQEDGRRLLFPEPTPLFYEPAAWGTAVRRERVQALTVLAAYHIPGAKREETQPLLVTTPRALMTRTLPRRDFLKVSRILRVGQSYQPDALARAWVEMGYEPAEIVVEPGQFSRRGGILDIWPPAQTDPVRLDFFGDELETLRQFDPASQRTARTLESLLVTPAREVLPGKAEHVSGLTRELEEFYLPLVYPAPASLLDYLPRPGLVVVDDLDLARSAASELEEQAVKLRQENIREGILPADFPIPYLTWSEIEDSLHHLNALELGRSTAEEDSPLAHSFQPVPRFGGRLKPMYEEINRVLASGNRAVIVSRQVQRLRELWREQASLDDLEAAPVFQEGSLGEGWILTGDTGQQTFLLTDSEIFGWDRPQPRARVRQQVEAPEAVYGDLRPGDMVVHVDYGIGRYAGLVQRVLEGAEREFLLVEYENGDQVYVPIHQADRISRYIGPEGEKPPLTRLGGGEWALTKQKVREAVLEVAQDLLELYARRQTIKGYAYKADTPWQAELEASFPYIETEDQLKAIREVKQDMEGSRPMDRLLCGDVGYGKTEVALRAAFKAVMDNRQVAVLVPTTVLAQQHYETFRQRLAAYPVEVEMLSRFRTPREQNEILRRLAAGSVDIVIGTHRLLTPDVEFKDLGLVVIDEEQRFGVTHKEHFKKLRTEIDVLTLTATPIPRTLYMALTGARDISIINTPPAERLPIVTHIGPYSPRLVRQAIVRELERGGQVFFVHNRVQTIRGMESHLRRLVPEARIGVAHGQMPEQDLSLVMRRFTAGEIDVLLCTSIIESGLDIPDANTLIVDRADAFGLAQLYQLRGRVGRGAQRAHAYFFRHRHKAPTPEGQERLEVIAENTQLGAGYSIAMRDLEMRGAGEFLGTKQHGYIAAVGFHLYTRLLSQAVRQIRQIQNLPVAGPQLGEVRELGPLVLVELPLSIGIPADYVSDANMRLKLYRRIADLESEDELEALGEEFVDRFGPLPEMVRNLFYQMKVKLLAVRAGLVSVTLEGEQIVLRYPTMPDGAQPRKLVSPQHDVRAGKNAFWMPLGSGDGWKARLVDVLEKLVG